MAFSEGNCIPAVMNVTPTSGNNNGNGGWGGDWGAWIILFLIFGMFGFGWGGYGGFGGGFGGGGASGALTRADLCQDMNFQSLENATRGIQQGLCDGFYAMNTSMLNGFHGVDNAVCNLGYNMQQGFNASNIATLQGQNALQTQLADCCCKTQTNIMQLGNQVERGFCQAGYNDQANTTAIIQNAHNDTDRVIARLDAMESARKDETIADLRQQLLAKDGMFNRAEQNNYLVNQLRPCPIPAYITCNPWGSQAPYGSCATYGGNYGGCGCGCN